eukprot:gene12708-6307_t
MLCRLPEHRLPHDRVPDDIIPHIFAYRPVQALDGSASGNGRCPGHCDAQLGEAGYCLRMSSDTCVIRLCSGLAGTALADCESDCGSVIHTHGSSWGASEAAADNTGDGTVGGHRKHAVSVADDGVAVDCVTNNRVALDSVALDSVALDSVALDSVALDSIALDSVALDSIALDSVAFNGVAFDGVAFDGGADDGVTDTVRPVDGSVSGNGRCAGHCDAELGE